MCEALATTREHVPPKCFFQKLKEPPKSLITIPSCDKHNNRKSNADSEMFKLVAISYGSGKYGQASFKDKWMSLSPKRRGESIPKDLREVTINGVKTGEFKFNTAAVYGFECAARGLFFEYARKDSDFRELTGMTKLTEDIPVAIIGSAMFSEMEPKFNIVAHDLIRLASSQITPAYIGQNPEIFKYRVHVHKSSKSDDNSKITILIEQVYFDGVIIIGLAILECPRS